MANIKKREIDAVAPVMPEKLPMLPELFANALPAPMPQMKWEDGIISNFFHNIKKGQIVKSTALDASIAESKNRMVRSNLDTIKALMTFGAEVEMCFKRLEQERFVMTHEKEMMGISKEKAQAELAQIQLKNLILQGEVKLNEVELKIKMKELEEVLNGSHSA